MRGVHVLEALVAPGDRLCGVAALPKMAMPECCANVKGYLEDERRLEPLGLQWGKGPVPEVSAACTANTEIDQVWFTPPPPYFPFFCKQTFSLT